jgi:Skp family chaperone for outer membrane proteins
MSHKELLEVLIKESVKTKFESKIDTIIEEKYKKHVKEEDEEDEDMDDEDEDDSDDDEDDDEDSDEDDSDEEDLKESMSVEYVEKGKKGTKTTTIKNHSELVKMAKTGNYEWFMVTKKNGEEVEYTIDWDGKTPSLVEM